MFKDSRKKRSEAFVNAFHSSENEVEVIPSNKDLFGEEEDDKEELVGAYCRVSTMSVAQVESYELQKAYYEEYVSRRPSWTLVRIYPDEGISATSIKKRASFLQMIEDCKQGKLTLIVTKSVSRFARNVVDGISYIRMLRNLPKPVAVYFETEHINTMSPGSDAQLSLLASFAESESLNKSVSMKWAIRSRFAHGIPRLVDLYGFDRTKAQLTPKEGEADVVRWMYREALKGESYRSIQKKLEEAKIPSPYGNPVWSHSTIRYILTNEKYVGDVLMQKTVRVDMFSHKSVKNTGQERQYRLHGHHEGIIDKEDWLHVQRRLGSCDYSKYFEEKPCTINAVEGVTFRVLVPLNKIENSEEKE